VPPDSVRCTTGQCPVHRGTRSQTRYLQEFPRALRYNSSDCPMSHRIVSGAHRTVPGAHRTVRCASGATATSRATVDCNALNARLHARVAHRTAYRACPVHHRTARRAHKTELQRSNPNGLLTWLAHRTVSGAPCDCSLPTATLWWLGL
jgi:hypothetical protein